MRFGAYDTLLLLVGLILALVGQGKVVVHCEHWFGVFYLTTLICLCIDGIGISRSLACILVHLDISVYYVQYI